MRTFSTTFKAAFGRAGCGRLGSFAVLAGNTGDDQEPAHLEGLLSVLQAPRP